MYLIVEKATQALLHMSNSFEGDAADPKLLFPAYDPETMVFGRFSEQRLPQHYEIRDGVVVDLDGGAPAIVPPADLGAEDLRSARARVRAALTSQALAKRARLVPDYQLLNAGLGMYDEARVAAIRATVQAFRDEVNRLEARIAKARSVDALNTLKPEFPSALVVPSPTAANKR